MQSYISVNLTSGGTNRTDSWTKRRTLLRQKNKNKAEIRRDAVKSWLRKIIAFLFSQVGVGALLVGYTILGALMFIEVESPTESRRMTEVNLLKAQVVSQLWNVTHNYNVIHTEIWRIEVDKIVENFKDSLVREIRLGYDSSNDPIWTFPSSLMYSLSVFTTIGYGNLSPKTDWGKALTICYALFGIPLLLLYMANVGSLLATSFRQFYSSVNRCKASLERIRKSRRMMGLDEKEKVQIDYNEGGGGGGNGDQVKRRSRLADVEETEDDEGKSREVAGEDNEKWTNEVTIPVSTCLAVFSFYIMGGSLIFCWWENWDYVDGSYFCFVSLVTIGFGDLVPGDSPNRRHHKTVDAQLILCSVYILFGMALMAMLFHLTQERFFDVGRRIGTMLHLI